MNHRLIGFYVLIAIFVARTSDAEGFRIYGMSADGQMRGEALVASSKGADANWYNPAALVKLAPTGNVSGGLNYLVLKAKYTSTTGQSVMNNDSDFPLPSFYYSQKVGPRWAFGIGLNTPFGLSTDYTDPSFNYITTGGEIKLVNVSPNTSFKISDSLSFGAGVNYYKSSTELRQDVPYSQIPPPIVPPGSSDSSLKVQGKGDGFGLNTGFLWSLSKTQNFGVTYKSEVTVDYDGEKAHLDTAPGINAPYDVGVKTRLRFPDMVAFGWNTKPTNRWDIEIGGQWTNWADMEKVEIKFEDQTFVQDQTTRFDWKNTWTARVGGTYALNDIWKLSGGYFYTTSPTRESTYTPLVPDGDHHVFSLGGTYDKGPLSVGIPLVLIIQTGTSNIQNDKTDVTGSNNVNGNYELMAYQLGLSASWKF
jgi:long-chain fatty acid transport protein